MNNTTHPVSENPGAKTTYFAGAARSAAEQEVRQFYECLANWERQHLDALQALYGGVRQEYWESSGFSPF